MQTDTATSRRAHGGVTATSRRTRSRLTDGRTLLPGVPSQSAWARLFRDMHEAMLEHVGGAAHSSEPQRLTARRIAVLETELRFQEVQLATIRTEGGEPDGELLDLYSRVSNTQRRHLEALGWARVPKDVTPDLRTYLAAHDANAATPEAATRVSVPGGRGSAPSPSERTSPALFDFPTNENGGSS